MSEISNNFYKNGNLMKIKSKYIVIKIFDNIKKSKLLKIINYNKKVQGLMKIKLNDYKNEFSKIEIEVIPKENIYGKFIHLYNKKIKSGIKIYFNDNKEEIKGNYINPEDNVTKIKIILSYKIKSLSRFFQYCKCIKIINVIKFNRNNLKDMSYMLCGCTSLKKINLSKLNTNNVTDMTYMFSGCSSLKELNLSNFNTNNVTDISYMFSGCSSLKELNLFNFNTNVTFMDHIFEGCSSLKELNLSNFNTNNVTYMDHMFSGCFSKLLLICTNNLINEEYKKLINYLIRTYYPD